MKINRGKLESSVLKGILSAGLSIPITYYGLRLWVVTTISTGPVDKIYDTINVAVVFVAVLTFLSSFLSSYLRSEE